jgi:hypothetical protein
VRHLEELVLTSWELELEEPTDFFAGRRHAAYLLREWKQCIIWCSSAVLPRSRFAEFGRDLHHGPSKSTVAVVAIIEDTSIGGLEACLHCLLSQSLGKCKSDHSTEYIGQIVVCRLTSPLHGEKPTVSKLLPLVNISSLPSSVYKLMVNVL